MNQRSIDFSALKEQLQLVRRAAEEDLPPEQWDDIDFEGLAGALDAMDTTESPSLRLFREVLSDDNTPSRLRQVRAEIDFDEIAAALEAMAPNPD